MSEFSGVDIWVSEGTYYTDESEDASIVSQDDLGSKFHIPYEVENIIGGFSGIENNKDQADPILNKTKLSGLIFEDSGITSVGSNKLIELNISTQIKFYNLEFQNSSDSPGCVFKNAELSMSTVRFEKCSFKDISGIDPIDCTGNPSYIPNISFYKCNFLNVQANGTSIIKGSFENCFFANSSFTLLNPLSRVEKCFFYNNTGDTLISKSISRSLFITDSVFAHNQFSNDLIDILVGDCSLRSCTFSNNFSPEISIGSTGSIYVGNCLFFRSDPGQLKVFNHTSNIGYDLDSSVISSFFGIWNASVDGFTQWDVPLSIYPSVFPWDYSIYNNAFYKLFVGNIPSRLKLFSSYGSSPYAVSNYSYSIFSMNAPSEIYNFNYPGFEYDLPNPFIDYRNPLGDDGIPFTDDDGLQLDLNSAWSDQAIDLQIIDYDFLGKKDIIGNPRVVAGKIDLGAYEYTPLEDADGDGIGDSNDAFPNNANETLDTDGDGLGDNEDSDDDGDGVDDSVEIATGTDPKQYNSALHSFVQALGGGTFDADDIAESRLAGQSDVTSDPNAFNLFTQADLTSATETEIHRVKML